MLDALKLSPELISHIEDDIISVEKEMDDDAESIITNERYNYVSKVIEKCFVKKDKHRLTVSDKIDRIVTNRFLALPIFAVIMFLVYYISVTTIGTEATDWSMIPFLENGSFPVPTSSWLPGEWRNGWKASSLMGSSPASVPSWLRAADGGLLYLPGIPRSLRVYGPDRLHPGPRLP